MLYWLAQAHFGRFAGIPVKITWTVFGLAPAVLVVTGALMWWKRVLRPWLARKAIVPPQRAATARTENTMQARF